MSPSAEPRHIEVSAKARFERVILAHRAQLELTVTAPRSSLALEEALELKQRCIRLLCNHGIDRDEIKEGGSDVDREWWRSDKKAQQSASHRLLFELDNLGRLQRALQALEPLFEGNNRYRLRFQARPPRFDESDAATSTAWCEAVTAARQQAEKMAVVLGLTLGPALWIEQREISKESTGMHGDSSPFLLYSAAAGPTEDTLDPDSPLQRNSVHVRARFELIVPSVQEPQA